MNASASAVFDFHCTLVGKKVEAMRLSRRQLMAVSAGGMLVPPPSLHAQTSTTSNVLRLAGPVSGIATLDPALTRDLQTMFIVRQIFRGLLQFDVSLQPVADLAELVEANQDLDSFTFQLREDCRFSDGRELATEDVVASFTRALNPVTAGGSAGSLAAVTYLRDIVGAEDLLSGRSQALTGVQPIDERTLSISLTSPSSTFMTRLASVPTAIVDAEQSSVNPEMWWQLPNSTGPFQIETIDQDVVVLVPNDQYPTSIERFSRVEIRHGVAANNPLNLFQGGQIDVVANASGEGSKLIDDPASDLNANVSRIPLFATSFIAFGNVSPPLDNVHVRRALQRLVSQTLVAQSMFSGTVQAASGMIPPGMLEREWISTIGAPDFEAARSELRVSRYGSAAELPVISIYAADIQPIEMLRELAATELGIRVEAIEVGWEDFLSGLAERRFPAYGLYWGADYPDPEAMLGMLFRSDGSDNYTGYRNDDFDALLDQARLEPDTERRATLYQKAQNVLIDDAGVIPLYFDVGVTVSVPEIANLPITPLGLLGLETVTSIT